MPVVSKTPQALVFFNIVKVKYVKVATIYIECRKIQPSSKMVISADWLMQPRRPFRPSPGQVFQESG